MSPTNLSDICLQRISVVGSTAIFVVVQKILAVEHDYTGL
jgi:hypothetical protein